MEFNNAEGLELHNYIFKNSSKFYKQSLGFYVVFKSYLISFSLITSISYRFKSYKKLAVPFLYWKSTAHSVSFCFFMGGAWLDADGPPALITYLPTRPFTDTPSSGRHLLYRVKLTGIVFRTRHDFIPFQRKIVDIES